MTVQCPTVISDLNKSVPNYRYSIIFSIFPVLNKRFFVKITSHDLDSFTLL